MIQKKSRFKPLYKKFFKLRQNIQNRNKLYKFKRSKWQNLLKFLRKTIKKFYIFDHFIYYKPKFGFYFTTKFKHNLHTKQKLSLFYGNLSKKYIKFIVKKSVKYFFRKKSSKVINSTINSNFIELLESRIDMILYRSHFVKSVRKARQLISHGHIYINNNKIKNNSYLVKKGDLININSRLHNIIKNNLNQSKKWPLPPKYLYINYKTFQIFLISHIKSTKIIYLFPFWLNINSLIKNNIL